ncbi:MAG: hypothetical protein ACTTIO_00035 [Candidatus Fimenecus sp.]
MNRQKDFENYRKHFPLFSYDNYKISEDSSYIFIDYSFSISNLTSFNHQNKILKKDFPLSNDINSPIAKRIIFYLGMVELISYWKCVCPKVISVNCGRLNDFDKNFFKKLWWGGLQEFFYKNGIKTNEKDFVEILSEKPFNNEYTDKSNIISKNLNLICIGGGKDSAVSSELLRRYGEKNKFLTVNDQTARTETVLAAGYTEKDILKIYRKIDNRLLTLNRDGYLNGHTPFSAVVAFLSYFIAYLIGAKNIVLSNESSANESFVKGKNINHQYSKSFEFENDFRSFTETNFSLGIEYFSLLRPFSELQIAKEFANFKKYHKIFRSCNKGSKQNIWCGECAKCLFVYSILSPFLSKEELFDIFGKNIFEDESLKNLLNGLAGFIPVKPFDCVGTTEELNWALEKTVLNYKKSNTPLPILLKHFTENQSTHINKNLIKEYNPEHNVPDDFLEIISEMYEDVVKSC